MIVGSSMLSATTLDIGSRRDISRIVYNHNTGLLDQIRREIGESSDSLNKVLASSPDAPTRDKPYVVVSIADHRLWYKLADSTLFTTQVATGSGKILEKSGGGSHWRFETPPRRALRAAQEQDPGGVPPERRLLEQGPERRFGLRPL